MNAPQRLQVGETAEMVIALATTTAVGEIDFTVRFDAQVLQVRAGAEGDWSAGSGTARFVADISDAEDHVRIRGALSGRRPGSAAGSVAIVQFQAVAPGTTSVTIGDVSVKDLAGIPLPFSLSSSNLQMTAESVPATGPAMPPAHGAMAADAPTAEPIDADD